MNWKDSKQHLSTWIKRLSTLLITAALGLELGNIVAHLNHQALPSGLTPVIWFERFAMTIHFFEGAIAAVYAPSRQKQPIAYGIYTFFVGTVGLLELFAPEIAPEHD